MATTSQGKALSHLRCPGELDSTASRQACGGGGGAVPGEKDFFGRAEGRLPVNTAGMSW